MLRTVSTLSQLISFKTSTTFSADEAREGLNCCTGEAEAAEALYKITGFASRFNGNQQQDSLSVGRLSRSHSSSGSPIRSRSSSPHPSTSLQHRFSPTGSPAASSASPLPSSSFGFTVDIDALEKEFPINPVEGKNVPPSPCIYSDNLREWGMVNLAHKAVYRGQYILRWRRRVPHGFGRLTFANGDVYTGQFYDGFHGKCGTLVSARNGYSFEYVGDYNSGYGVLSYSHGETVRAYYVFGKKEGRGWHSWPDGRLFIGQYKEDLKQGRGQYVFNNGNSKYEGDWTDDEPTGQGTIWHSDGRVYEGGVQMAQMHGLGRYTDAKGRVEVDIWENGSRIGENAVQWPNGKATEPCCPVCQEMYAQDEWVKKLPCNHWFHLNCIGRWAFESQRSTCPVCRQPFRPL